MRLKNVIMASDQCMVLAKQMIAKLQYVQKWVTIQPDGLLYVANQTRKCGRSAQKLLTELEDLKDEIERRA